MWVKVSDHGRIAIKTLDPSQDVGDPLLFARICLRDDGRPLDHKCSGLG